MKGPALRYVASVRFRAAAVGLLAVSTAQCMLIIDDDVEVVAGQCRFAGSETTCGGCIASKCQSRVDACCDDRSCERLLGDVEDCARNDHLACFNLAARTGDDAVGNLARCIQSKCANECPKDVSVTWCVGVTGDQHQCYCSGRAPKAANELACDETYFPDSVCCADPDFPAEDSQCTCEPFGCEEGAYGCECGLYGSGSDYRAVTSSWCQGTYCCAYGPFCSCREDEPCYEDQGEVPVDICSSAVINCLTRSRVTICSTRTE